MSSSILLTGFEPFGGRADNPSWEVVRRIAAMPEFEGKIMPVRLPVSFEKAPEAIRRAMAEHKPDAVLMLGFSAKREKISVERAAINIKDAKNPDNDGVRPVDEPIAKNGPAAIFSTLPIKTILGAIQGAGIDAIVSNSAGTYVCNTAFYSALNYAKRLSNHPKVGFIHLPDTKTETAVAALTAAIRILIHE